MNIYYINPTWLEPNKFESFLNILKVKIVISLIKEEAITNELLQSCKGKEVFDISTLLWWRNKPDIKNFLQKVVSACISTNSTGTMRNRNSIDVCTIKDMYKHSKADNPIFNLENLDDPNILVLRGEYKKGHELYIAHLHFKRLMFDTLNKYGEKFDYKHHIAIVDFDQYLFLSRIESPDFHNIYNIYELSSTEFYNPMLVYLNAKSSYYGKGLTLQEKFLKKGARRAMEKYIIEQKEEDEERRINESIYAYDADYDPNDWGQEGELREIYENGGDWILDS